MVTRNVKKKKNGLKYRSNSVERKMLDTCFSKTKALLVNGEIYTKLENGITEMVLWKDPTLKEEANKIMIYDSIRTKALTL